MRSAMYVGFWTALWAVAYGWSKYNFDNSWQPARRSFCVGSGGKCYASDQCCKGFVCAAFDDLFGLNPEVPGFCVREKDLHPCATSMDCSPDNKCMGLGRNGETYCVERPDPPAKEDAPKKPPKYHYPKTKVGLGDDCDDDSDCREFTSDGKDELCCQNVKRYRQKARIICDRVTPISNCIKEN